MQNGNRFLPVKSVPLGGKQTGVYTDMFTGWLSRNTETKDDNKNKYIYLVSTQKIHDILEKAKTDTVLRRTVDWNVLLPIQILADKPKQPG